MSVRDEAQKGPQREIKFAQSLDGMLESLQRIERHAGITENADDEGKHAFRSDERSQRVGDLEEKLIRTLEKEDEIYDAVVDRLFQPDLRPPPEVWRPAVSRRQESIFHSGILNGLVCDVPDEIDRREEAIFEPYQDTFSWIFQEQPQEPQEPQEPGGRHEPFQPEFPVWLENNSRSPFWITGKPGSGKSTLMKFIIHAPQLKRHLEKWAADFPLQITSFYAWVAGTKLQNSASGFMRTILYQCIRSSSPYSDVDLNLASTVSSRRWALFATLRSCNKQPSWEDWELKEAFGILLTEIVKNKRVVFFVDGLDEFKLLPKDTLDIIQDLCGRDGIKVCVASRPWLEFNDALDSFPMLRMQDLTRDDMEKFVEGSFNDNRGFREQRQAFPEQVDALVQEVVEKANGVFLWSRVVVRDLLIGFTQGDGLPRLAEILSGLPDDVEDLYTRIWRGIDKRKPDFARLVALRRAAFEPPDFLRLWLADGGHSKSLDVQNLSEDRRGKLRLQMVRRLDSATRGILELSPTSKVDFLHRTAMDWAAQDEVWEEISSHLDSNFNPSLNLLQAEALAYTGLVPRAQGNRGLEIALISQVLRYAHGVGKSPQDKDRAVEILGEFEKRLRCVNWTTQSSRVSDSLNLMCSHCALPYLEAKLTKRYLMKYPLDCGAASPLELAVFGERGSFAGEDCIPLDIRRATVELILGTGAPAKMRKRARERARASLRVIMQRGEAKPQDRHWRYMDDVLSLLTAEDEKRGGCHVS